MLRRAFAEPLFHFVLVGLAVFAAYGLMNPSVGGRRQDIVVSAPKIEQLAGFFARTWQRPPTSEEMKGLIDDYVKEEIYYREALDRGLDKDDETIRRRLRLKMEYLQDAGAETITPTEAQLAAYYKANAAKFELDSSFALQQVFFSPQKHGDRIDADAAALLAQLKTRPPASPDTLGDDTLLPFDVPMTSREAVAQTFGRAFADALDKAPVGQWVGPFLSSYGLHLVRVTERTSGRIPELAEVREIVSREWAAEEKKRLQDQQFADLLKRYKVTIQLPAEGAPQSAPAR